MRECVNLENVGHGRTSTDDRTDAGRTGSGKTR